MVNSIRWIKCLEQTRRGVEFCKRMLRRLKILLLAVEQEDVVRRGTVT